MKLSAEKAFVLYRSASLCYDKKNAGRNKERRTFSAKHAGFSELREDRIYENRIA